MDTDPLSDTPGEDPAITSKSHDVRSGPPETPEITEDGKAGEAESAEATDERSAEQQAEDEEDQRRFRLAGLPSWPTRYGMSGQGSNVSGRDQTIHQHFGSASTRTARPFTLLSAKQLRDIRRYALPTRSQLRLTDRLEQESVMLLRGRPASGWRTTAYAALLSWWETADGGGDASMALLNGDHKLTELTAEGLGDAPCLLLDAQHSLWQAHPDFEITHLRDLLKGTERRIVVLVTGECAVTDCVVDHDPPDGLGVFRRWLLPTSGSGDPWLDHNLNDHSASLSKELTRRSPGEIQMLAVEVAEALRAGREMGEILVELRPPPREQLREELDENVSLLRRCFLIGTGVLHGLSEARISRAALRLAELVNETQNEKDRPGPPVWESLRSWLKYDGLSAQPPSAGGDGHRITLRQDPAAQVVPVAWEETPALREPLHAWLHELSQADDDRTAIRAAQAVAQLAACDFQVVETEFLERWCAANTQQARRLAKYAMEAAAFNPDLDSRIHTLLRRWSLGNLAHRKTAAVTYGSQIGVWDIEKALSAFGTVIRHSDDRQLHAVVAASVTEVYTASTAGQILKELQKWTEPGSQGQGRTAALALVRLAYLPENAPDRPALITRPHTVGLDMLWCNALERGLASPDTGERATSPEAWHLLGRWVARTPLLPVVEKIFKAATTGHPSLCRPLRLYLRLWEAQTLITAERRAALNDLLRAR
ncbi:hypothetical protein [Streptosporangium roseum]|uniref:hypothetical protein n=1 Tax=Streptosporangium roseum TaxID=2001 RepID=UPI0004CDD846|nr:hypothetical protein [Streptosporangium roseum]